MNSSKFAKLINNIIALFILGLVIFAWCKKIINNQIVTIIITAMTLTIIATEIHHFSKKRTNRLNLKNEELKFQKQCIWHFLQSQHKANVAFFKKALSNYYNFDNSTTLLNDKQKHILIIPQFENTVLTINNLLSCIKQAKTKNAKKLIIFCVNKDKEIDNILQNITNLEIIILNDYETYGLLKQINMFPIEKQNSTLKNKKIHALLNKENFLSRAKIKPFLFCGIMLYISSLFVPYKVYYIIIASICLLISAICLIFAKNPKQISNYELILENNANNG